MAPIATSIGLLALASAALAKPYHGGLRHAHHRRQAQPYTFSNGTTAGPTGTGTAAGTGSSTLYSTQTVTSYVSVVPVAGSSSIYTNGNDVASSSTGAAGSDCAVPVTVTL